MKNNNYPKLGKKINVIKAIFFILLTYALISSWIRFFDDINTIIEEQNAEEEELILVGQKNSQIDLLTQIDNSFFSKKIEYLEFEQDINIPLPNYLMEEENIVSCKKGVETNYIANNSPVVKITYGIEKANTGMILDIFCERLPEDYNYESVLYYFDDGTKIYTRTENAGYFSYIIYKGAELTCGICYGEPELNLDL